MWPSSDRWDLGRSHTPTARVELWHRSERLVESVPFVDGVVTEKWVTGIRATLSLTVDPSSQWLAWLALPDLELVPFAGVSWGRTSEEVPLGVFPVLFPGVPAPVKTITLSCRDHWQYVDKAKFLYPTMSYPGLIRDVAARLVSELGIGAGRIHPVTKEPVREPLITASSTAGATSVLWQGSRTDAVSDLVDAISAECFINRFGQPEVRDRLSQTGTDLVDGVGGTIATVDPQIDWSQVINVISVTSSKNDVTFDPAIAMITDPEHPAAINNIGPSFDTYSSPLILDRDQAMATATTMLAKRSAPARSWTVSCIPDPRRMPADEFDLTTSVHGTNRVVVQEVTHPLVGGMQQVKVGAV